MNEKLKEYNDKMQKSFDFLRDDLASIRAGRANPHVLDKIKVDYYGTPTPIQQVGNVSVPEARIIQIAPWDKTLIKDIEKAIMMSDLGITPSNDGAVIRLVFPARSLCLEVDEITHAHRLIGLTAAVHAAAGAAHNFDEMIGLFAVLDLGQKLLGVRRAGADRDLDFQIAELVGGDRKSVV